MPPDVDPLMLIALAFVVVMAVTALAMNLRRAPTHVTRKCPHCRRAYDLPHHRVAGRTVRILCLGCKKSIVWEP